MSFQSTRPIWNASVTTNVHLETVEKDISQSAKPSEAGCSERQGMGMGKHQERLLAHCK